MLLLKTHEGDQESLMDHVYELQQNRDINVRKQSLHSRFSPAAVAFIKEVIAHQLKTKPALENNTLLKSFSKVFLQDATKFGLPEQLEKEYPSYGPKTKAGGQIQFTYELKNQQVYHLSLYPATRSEALSATDNSWIEKDSLVLRDLGYFTVKGFKEIIAKEAFFISRAKPKTSFYTLDNKKFEMRKLIDKMNKHQIDCCEKDLIMGFEKKNKLSVRVIFCRVPDEVKEQRLRKAFKNAKDRNWEVTNDYKLWAGISVFITNVSKEVMSTQSIPLAYKLRWQVELIFKTWKSHHKIHLYKAVKKERVECYLYATLLLILLQTCLYSWLQQRYTPHKVCLSIHKFSKVLIHLKELFARAIRNEKNKYNELVRVLLSLSRDTLKKETRKGKTGYVDIINLCL